MTLYLNSRNDLQPKRSLLRSSAAAAFVCSGVFSLSFAASAQESPASEVDATARLQTVTVTARKVEESLQTTPVSVTAVSGADLDAKEIDTTEDLGRLAPNLVITQGQGVSGNASAGAYFIRGIGQIDYLLNTDPGVGVYVDGVYLARSMGSIIDLIELDRVEVLRGPQGTLFGRNTIGGAVNLVSKAPTEDFAAKLKATVGSFERKEVQGSINGQLAEGLTGRLSALYRDRDGWVDRITDGSTLGAEETLALRGALRFEPTDALTVDLAVDYSDTDGTSSPFNVVEINETAQFAGFHNGALVGPPCVPPPGALNDPRCFNPQWVTGDLYSEQGVDPSNTELEAFGASLIGEYAFNSNFSIKSITGYRDTTALGNRDGDHTPILIQNTRDTWEHEQFSQELEFIGEGMLDGKLDWILGLYYFQEEGENLNFVTFPVVSFQSGGAIDNDNTAVFGQATYNLTDRLSVTAGARWTDETKRFTPDQIVLADPTGLFPPGSVPGFPLTPNQEFSVDFEEVTPMVNVAYDWNDRLMTYVSYSEGFKSGGFTQRIFPPLPAPPPFDPEFVESVEAGFKFEAESGKFRLNGAAFMTDYSDLQVLVLVGVQPLTSNAAGAEIQGFELEFEALPMADLLITGSVGYVDAEYTELEPSVAALGISESNAFAQVPEWTGSLSASYEFDLGPGSVLPRIDIAYQSESFMDAVNTESLKQDSYALVNASVAYRPDNAAWELKVFGKNLTDEEYYLGGFADLPDQGYAEAAIGRPTEWGISLAVEF
ncbi:TonB-dependent receptor [Hyphomonas sp.]|uniref:TonB-dependent receptor n=1 Tax=Hyphomonas sp. TaxID=87 RepID=UPI003F6F52BD|tara:strand:+ start:6290 stop:8605 length:2316 start_codon:yes stop_codon:yes gene_type:complete